MLLTSNIGLHFFISGSFEQWKKVDMQFVIHTIGPIDFPFTNPCTVALFYIMLQISQHNNYSWRSTESESCTSTHFTICQFSSHLLYIFQIKFFKTTPYISFILQMTYFWHATGTTCIFCDNISLEKALSCDIIFRTV